MRIIERTCIVIIFFYIALVCFEARADKRIGVLMFSKQARCLEVAGGFVDALKDAGFGQAQAKITVEEAGADKAGLRKRFRNLLRNIWI
jgi:ABC-type uncharacterized transport system substrate-binding protein